MTTVDATDTVQTGYEFSNNWFGVHEAYWRQHLIPWVQRKGAVRILEIGAYEGRSSCWMLDNLMAHPASHLVCVDLWPPRPHTHESAEQMEAVFERFRRNIARTGQADRVTVIRGDSKVALKDWPGPGFDLIYVDGDHAEAAVYADTLAAFPLLNSGGVMLWDDYFSDPAQAVKRGIDRACRELGIQLLQFGRNVAYVRP